MHQQHENATQAIGRYNWRSVAAYPSPAGILQAPNAEHWQTYFAHDLPMRSPRVFSVAAPPYGRTRTSYPARNVQHGKLPGTTGAAPTAGIYTGLPQSGFFGNPY